MLNIHLVFAVAAASTWSTVTLLPHPYDFVCPNRAYLLNFDPHARLPQTHQELGFPIRKGFKIHLSLVQYQR
jgi:hypothetical protein